jgi:FLVCR family feline leukemia virus subgroup C receptor-related protein
LNCQANISSAWFLPKSRAVVTSLLSFAVTISSVIGLLVPGLIFYGYNENNDPGYTDGKQKVQKLLQLEFFVTVVAMGLNIIFIQNKVREFAVISASHAAY